MYIQTNHVEMDTSKPKNKSIMSIKKKENMFVIENCRHIEHRHTKGRGCLKQHNTGWKQHMERYL